MDLIFKYMDPMVIPRDTSKRNAIVYSLQGMLDGKRDPAKIKEMIPLEHAREILDDEDFVTWCELIEA